MSESSEDGGDHAQKSWADQVYPEELRAEEERLVEERREKARGKKAGEEKAAEGKGVIKGNLEGNKIGVACSGGGIRSATFSLGFFQGLAKLRDRDDKELHLLKHIDFLSTVSGGGYFGAFFGRLISRGTKNPVPGSTAATGIERAEEVLENNQSDEVTWLREHGRYISPTGRGDTLVAVAVFLRNWITLHFILGAGFVLLFFAVSTLRSILWNCEWYRGIEAYLAGHASSGIWWSPAIIPALIFFSLVSLPLGWAYWLAQLEPKTARSRTPVIASAVVLLTGLFLLHLISKRGAPEVRVPEILIVPGYFAIVVVIAFCLLSSIEKWKFARLWWMGFVLLFAGVGLISYYKFFSNAEGEVDDVWWVLVRVIGLFVIVAVVAVIFSILIGRSSSKEEERQLRFEGLLVVALIVLPFVAFAFFEADGVGIGRAWGEGHFTIGIFFISSIAALAFVFWVIGIRHVVHRMSRSAGEGVRNVLSVWLARTGIVVAVVLAFGLVDTLGQTLYASYAESGTHVILNAMIATVVGSAGFAAVGNSIGDLFKGTGGDGKPAVRVSLSVLAGVASILLWGSLIVLYASFSQMVFWENQTPVGNPGEALNHVWGSEVVASASGFELEEESKSTFEMAKRPRAAWPMLGITSLVFGLLYLLGHNLRFINYSSYQRLYSARLTRAYLGASNPKRRTTEGQKISESIDGDDEPFDEYAPHAEGGPLHLVNVTINETVGGRSQIEQRDRKGMPMCVGPVGMSARLRYHAKWVPDKELDAEKERYEICLDKPQHPTENWVEIDPIALPEKCDGTPASDDPAGRAECYHMFQPRRTEKQNELVERLSLGDWVSISGAAFSTGLGAKTSLWLSSLLGFINVRLGYWWDSGIRPSAREGYSKKGVFNFLSRAFFRVFPSHAYLWDEVLARFHGSNRRRWYLSDGGHFENTSCYELLRRRVPMIVVLDCGADPDYDFEDLANLVRMARTDLGAEIEFLKQDKIDERVDPDIREYFGTPAQIRRRARELKEREENELFHGRSYSKKHAALAQVRFDGEENPTCEILWIKPSLCGDEPIDIRNYHGANPDFPQQTTADQFFDEAQWESYRKLGEEIAKRLYYDDEHPEKSWTPLRWFEQRKSIDTYSDPDVATMREAEKAQKDLHRLKEKKAQDALLKKREEKKAEIEGGSQ